MLSDKYRYVAMDFETTGLDLSKDEAIQIWLVEVDVFWNVVRQFKSFIQPDKPVSELKTLVSYITWISVDDIKSAPKFDELMPEILKFFGEDVIVIWHNIQFDINFLEKYVPDVKYFDSIDTFYLAQNLIHFPLSYALDVLVESLMTNKEFKEIFLRVHGGQEFDVNEIHDGLYDSQNSLALFFYEIARIDLLMEKYPVLFQILTKNVWLYNKILEYKGDRAKSSDEKISLPPLKKQLPTNTSLKTELEIPLENYKIWERYFVWNVELRQLVNSLISSNQQIILAFASVAKLNIVKNMLTDAGIKNIGFAKWYTTIDQVSFSRFLNKSSFSDNEFLFVVKYLSHVLNDGSVLDLNTKTDYKINYYIQSEKKFENFPVVLSTHGGLYSMLKNPEHKYRNYDVCFFDVEMWYKWYNDFQSQPCDLYPILSFLDTLLYKYTLDGEKNWQEALESFASFFEIFMWVLFAETKKCFVNVQDTHLVLNPILENINFFDTNKLILQFSEHKSVLQECLSSKDFENLWMMMDNLFSVLWNIVDVKKIMYDQSEFYFTYAESTKYTNWEEFKDVFPSWVYFFSDFEKVYPKLLDGVVHEDNFKIKKIWDIDAVVWYIDDTLNNSDLECIYVLSTIKDESKEIFDKLYSLWIDGVEYLVENITGSLWKNIFKAKTQWRKVIVWGYSFLMWIFSNKINIDICIDFNIIWKQSKYLLEDIKRYAKNYY